MAESKILAQKRIVIYATNTQSTGSIASLNTTSLTFDSVNYSSSNYELIDVIPMCQNGWCKTTVNNITIANDLYRVFIGCYNGHSSEARTFDVSVRFVFATK